MQALQMIRWVAKIQNDAAFPSFNGSITMSKGEQPVK
jgi:hypothetical protein